MQALDQSILKRLENKQLTAVVFVMDYLELHFEDSRLTAYDLPSIRHAEEVFFPATPGYRDTLCALLGKRAIETAEVADESLMIRFEESSTLEISLRDADRDGPEAAMYWETTSARWNVW